MATITLIPATGTGSRFGTDNVLMVGNGSADLAICVQVAGDGKFDTGTYTPSIGAHHATNLAVLMADPGSSLPQGITIQSVQLNVLHKMGAQNNNILIPGGGNGTITTPYTQGTGFSTTGFDQNPTYLTFTSPTAYTTWTKTYTTNPNTGVAWTRSDLFNVAFGAGSSDTQAVDGSQTYSIDYLALIVTYQQPYATAGTVNKTAKPAILNTTALRGPLNRTAVPTPVNRTAPRTTINRTALPPVINRNLH